MKVIERFDKYMKLKGLNDNKVTNSLGLSVGLLGKSRQPKRDLSGKVIEQILNFYTDLDRVWLLTGEGDMLSDSPARVSDSPKGIPIYDIDATCGFDIRDFNGENIIGYVDLPQLKISEMKIIKASGDSMAPVIKNGDYIGVREISDKNVIVYGRAYLIITEDYRMIKYIRRDKNNDDNILLQSENPQYDDFTLPKKSILRLYIVEADLQLNVFG